MFLMYKDKVLFSKTEKKYWISHCILKFIKFLNKVYKQMRKIEPNTKGILYYTIPQFTHI